MISLVKATLLCSILGLCLLEPSVENIFSPLRTSQLSRSTVIIVAALAFYEVFTNRAWSMLMLIRFCLRNNANVVVPPTVSAVSKKEPHENIARIAKRYLDDNMQQAWINPRLISMVSEYKCNDYAPDPRTCVHPCPLYSLARSRARTRGGYLRARTFRADRQISLRRTSTLGKFRD